MSESLNNAGQSWDALADKLETFIARWEEGGGPPTLNVNSLEGSTWLRRLTLVELVKIDLEYRRQTGAPFKRIEEYAAEYPLLMVDGKLSADLIYEEYHVRRSNGEPVEPKEYCERFPEQAGELRKLMGLDSPEVSLSLMSRGSPRVELEAGQKIDDFDLLIKLGKGAFASVFLARQTSMQRLVALKASADKGTEPQTLAQLDHPFIVRVYDQRRVPEQRLRLLYMQYVAGGTLQGVVERVRQLPASERSGRLLLEAVDSAVESGGQTPLADTARRRKIATLPWSEVVCMLGAQLASALDYAHRKGVLHRDIKPANVLLAADLSPKLADFNISFSANIEGATPAAYFGGSLAYMSPEQLEACNPSHDRQPQELDGRADLYSLAVLLWELLHGSRPFADEPPSDVWAQTLTQMAERRRHGPPGAGSPDAFDGDCEAQVRRVLCRCMSPEPADRHASGEELYRDLLLCRSPHTRRLLSTPRRGWREIARKVPLFSIVVAALSPHALAALFSIFYNYFKILEPLKAAGVEGVEQAYVNSLIVINGIAFPMGVVAAIWLGFNLIRGLQGGPGVKAQSPEEHFVQRKRALLIGHYGALVGIAEWSVAGLAYPIWLSVACGQQSVEIYLHFLASLVLCGLIAAAYPFFTVTYLCVRAFYPMLLRNSPATEEDQPVLAKVNQLAGRYLLVAGGVPLLGIAALAIAAALGGIKKGGADPLLAIIFGLVSGLGVLGFLATYGVYSVLQRDLSALSKAATPADPFGTTTDSMTVF